MRVSNRKYKHPLPTGTLPIRSSDVPLFSGVIGSRSPAGFVLPPPETPASLSPFLRGGVPFFATHLRASHRNVPSGGPKPDEYQSPGIATPSCSSPARELDRTAVEVAEFLAHLFKREPEGKKRSAASTGRLSVRSSSRSVAIIRAHPSTAASAVSRGEGLRRAAGASAPSAVRKRSGPSRAWSFTEVTA
jgi:hypothetical protein